ncbi:Fc receptor-like protein 5, partial [Clarias magur]
GDVILKSPVHPVTEGNPLTLHCLYRNTKISDSGVNFYKNDSILQFQTTGEMTISRVSKSDEGFYHCKHPERGESPKSWVSVRVSVSGSSGVVVGLSLAFVFIILIVLLILLLRFKETKGIGYQIPSTVNQDNNQPAAHHPIYENSALMSRVDYAAGSSNTMYSQAVTWKKYHKDDSALGENHTVYSMIEMKNMNPKDAATDLSDVIYVEVDLTNQKRPKRKQERRSEEADTVYSELNQNTDQ